MKTQNKIANAPVRTLRHAGISASIWKNETEKGTMFSVTFERSYKDKGSDEWKHTQSFGRNNLLLLSLLASRAFEWIIQQPGATRKA
jgi:hypothetical protein